MTDPKDLHIWQGMCGCWHSTRARRTPWFYKPQWWFDRWSPVWLGGDEWCRRTLVLGWCFTGQIVIPLWYCRTPDPDWEICGCGPDNFDSSNWGHQPEMQTALRVHQAATEKMRFEYEKFCKEVDELEDL